jgi:hypothetical protein
MRYALLMYLDPAAAARTTADEAMAELARYGAMSLELREAGVLTGGEAFMPASSACTVEIRAGSRAVSPVAAAARELSGFFIVDCEHGEALDIAGRMPVAHHGAVEVRPLLTLPAHLFPN